MSNQVTSWTFTTFNVGEFTPPVESKWFRYLVYQTEICPETGREHFQGYVEFTRSQRMKSVKDLCNDNTMHLEVRQGTREQARAYCMKEDTRKPGEDNGPWEFGTWDISPGQRVDLSKARETILSKRKLEECYSDPELDKVTSKYPRWVEKVHSTKKQDYDVDIELRQWQIDVLAMLNEPVKHRRIIWIWSSQSGTGKTTFRDYVSLKLDVLPARGKLQDILYAYDNNQIIWFDYTRAQQGYESYDTLEELSNVGYKLATKYNSIRKFVRAHIVVTSNHPPSESKLPDRFHIVCLDSTVQDMEQMDAEIINTML